MAKLSFLWCGREIFYDFDAVSDTSGTYTEISVFDNPLKSATIYSERNLQSSNTDIRPYKVNNGEEINKDEEKEKELVEQALIKQAATVRRLARTR